MPAAANEFETEESLDDAARMAELAEAEARRPAEVGTGVKVAAGTMWVMLQTVATKGVMAAGQLLLGWLLSPEDFGEIGLAYTVTAFVTLLTNPGIDLILISRGRRFRFWSTPAFYFSLATGVLGGLVILATAPVVAHFYDSPRLVGLLSVLALATPIGALQIVPLAKLRSKMDFRTAAAIALGQSALQTVLTVAFAALGAGVYAFVLPMPIVYVVAVSVLWRVARPTIHVRDAFRYWKYLVGDTGYIFGQRLLVTMVVQGDYIILGSLYGPEVVGPYFFAYSIATQAIRLTAGSLHMVLIAGLSRMPAFSPQQTQGAFRATKAIALCGMPLCILQAVLVGPLLNALYGDKWNAAIPLVQLLSIGLAFDVISWPACSLLEARGQFRFYFLWTCFSAMVFLACVFIGAYFGKAFGAALATCFFYALASPPFGSWIFCSSGVRGRDMAAAYAQPLVVAIITGGTSLAVIRLTQASHPFLQLILAGSAGAVAALVGARLIAPEPWNDVFAKLVAMLPKTRLLKS